MNLSKKLSLNHLLTDTLSIILLGLILRIVVAPFTLNWDLLSNAQQTSQFSHQSLSEFYKNSLSVYPPLMYQTYSFYLSVIRSIFSDIFNAWFSTANISAITFPYIFRIIFLLKLPFLTADLASGIIFSRLFENSKRKIALLLWMISPVSLYTVSAWTNVDIIPIFFILLSFFLFYKKKILTSAFILGLAVSYKIFPVFLLPFLIFTQNQWRKKAAVLTVGILPVILTHLSVIGIPQYFQHTMSGGYSSQILFSLLPIGPNRSLIYFYLFYFLLFFHYLDKKHTYYTYFIYSLLSLVPIFIFSFFNLQWFLWILPLLLFYQVNSQRPTIFVVIVYISYFALALLSQASLNIGMFAPIDQTLWKLDWPQKSLLGDKQLFTFLNTIHSLLAAALIFMSYQLIKQDKKVDL